MMEKILLRNFEKIKRFFVFAALHFCAKKIAICIIIRKLHFAQSGVFPLLRYSVLRNFAEHNLIKKLIKGINCIH